MVHTSDEFMRANSKAFIYKLEVMEFAIEKATKGFLQDDKGAIFCLEARDVDMTTVLLAQILRALKKEAFLKQNLDEIYTDFCDFARMSQQQNIDWTNNFPNLLICKVGTDEQLNEKSYILKAWVKIVKDESKKIIFIVENSKYLERHLMTIGMANLMKFKLDELWERNGIPIEDCKKVTNNQANKYKQNLVNDESASARALDEDIVRFQKKSKSTAKFLKFPHVQETVQGLDSVNSSGNTQLHFAACGGRLEVVKSLLVRGAKKEVKNIDGETALHLAASRGHIAIVNILLEHGANSNATDQDLRTPLHNSCSNPNSAQLVELLIKFGAEVEKKCADGKTSLHLACRFGNIEVLNTLLQHGANLNSLDNFRRPPLYEAINYNKPEVVLILLQNGADFNIENSYHETALDKARDRNDTNMCKILEDHAALIKNGR